MLRECMPLNTLQLIRLKQIDYTLLENEMILGRVLHYNLFKRTCLRYTVAQ